jgi:hypothetical protein
MVALLRWPVRPGAAFQNRAPANPCRHGSHPPRIPASWNPSTTVSRQRRCQPDSQVGSEQRRPVLGPSRRRPVPWCRIATVTPTSIRRMTPEAGCFPYRPSIDPLFWLSPGGADRSRPLTGHPIHDGGSSASEGLLGGPLSRGRTGRAYATVSRCQVGITEGGSSSTHSPVSAGRRTLDEVERSVLWLQACSELFSCCSNWC